VKRHLVQSIVGCGLLLFCVALANAQASIEGRVTLPKPEPADLLPPRYPGQVGEALPPDPPTAVVYLEGQFPKTASPVSTHMTNEVRQLGMQFHPRLLPIEVGTAVIFPNQDDFYHNVFSYSKPKRFDLGRYRKSERPAVQVFDKPGVVKLYCDIHRHMRGVILVLNTPYFTSTDTNGLYQLRDLPAGRYVLKAWLDEQHVYERPVSLKAGDRLRVDFAHAATRP
jgi:plastocyanin